MDMEFKANDKVVGNHNGYSHRLGKKGTVLCDGDYFTGVMWSDGDIVQVAKNGIDLVENHDPPRKMHPDDFMLAISEFAADNGFGITQLEFHGTEFIGAALPRHSYAV
jgi:hypothetical protein